MTEGNAESMVRSGRCKNYGKESQMVIVNELYYR